jgi:hypothetical protein
VAFGVVTRAIRQELEPAFAPRQQRLWSHPAHAGRCEHAINWRRGRADSRSMWMKTSDDVAPSSFPRQVCLLAAIGLVLQALDLFTGIEMMARDGLSAEQNPVARALILSLGPAGLVAAKLGTALAITYVFMRIEHRGRGRLARNVLSAVAIFGLLGLISNLT